MFGRYVGRIGACGGLTLTQRALGILRRPGVSAHVWRSGIGSAFGLPAGNFVDAGKTTLTTPEGIVACVGDAIGVMDLLQSTPADRPFVSARYNLLTNNTGLDTGAWNKGTGTTATKDATGPDGIPNSAFSVHISGSSEGIYRSAFFVGDIKSIVWLRARAGTPQVYMDFGGGNPALKTLSTNWQKFYNTRAFSNEYFALRTEWPTALGDVDIEVFLPTLMPASTPAGIPDIQRVDSASSYDTNGFPWVWKFDATDKLSVTFPSGYEVATVIDAAPSGLITSTEQNIVGAYDIASQTRGRIIIKASASISAGDLVVLQRFANLFLGA